MLLEIGAATQGKVYVGIFNIKKTSIQFAKNLLKYVVIG